MAIAQCVIYLATAPKSNAAYAAFKKFRPVRKGNRITVTSKHILNAPTSLMKDLGYGDGYQYDHASEDGFSGQNYFPEGMRREEFYLPEDRGFERDIGKRLGH